MPAYGKIKNAQKKNKTRIHKETKNNQICMAI